VTRRPTPLRTSIGNRRPNAAGARPAAAQMTSVTTTSIHYIRRVAQYSRTRTLGSVLTFRKKVR